MRRTRSATARSPGAGMPPSPSRLGLPYGAVKREFGVRDPLGCVRAARQEQPERPAPPDLGGDLLVLEEPLAPDALDPRPSSIRPASAGSAARGSSSASANCAPVG
ncbi:MAG: hypothetical protein ACRDZ4_14335 [Egibacteraceae bacterium]